MILYYTLITGAMFFHVAGAAVCAALCGVKPHGAQQILSHFKSQAIWFILPETLSINFRWTSRDPIFHLISIPLKYCLPVVFRIPRPIDRS